MPSKRPTTRPTVLTWWPFPISPAALAVLRQRDFPGPSIVSWVFRAPQAELAAAGLWHPRMSDHAYRTLHLRGPRGAWGIAQSKRGATGYRIQLTVYTDAAGPWEIERLAPRAALADCLTLTEADRRRFETEIALASRA